MGSGLGITDYVSLAYRLASAKKVGAWHLASPKMGGAETTEGQRSRSHERRQPECDWGIMRLAGEARRNGHWETDVRVWLNGVSGGIQR